MTIAQVFSGVNEQEKVRRMAVVDRMNVLWTKGQKSKDESEKKQIENRIKRTLRQEQFWMKDVAYFLY